MSRPTLSWLLVVLVLTGCEPFEPWFDYAADDPNLQFIGRMDFSSPLGPVYAFPNTIVRFRFHGTGVDVMFDDKAIGDDLEKSTNFINIIVDGKHEAKIELKRGAHVYRGARNLPEGEHLVEIVKRTEAYAGAVQFLGLSLQGVLLEPPPRQQKRMEFIGDSISCGYGNEVSIYAPTYTEPNTGYHATHQDASKAYGPLTARKFDAEAVVTCVSGAGVYRNNDGSTDRTFPVVYGRILPNDEKSRWDFQRYVPDLIVINLGTNDFGVVEEPPYSSAPPADAFKSAYTNFLQRLRELYPRAKIVCAVGPLLNDNYPPGRQHWTLAQQWVTEVVQAAHARGDTNVHYVAFPPMDEPYGEDWHPTLAVHQRMADDLADFLRTIGY